MSYSCVTLLKLLALTNLCLSFHMCKNKNTAAYLIVVKGIKLGSISKIPRVVPDAL